MLVPAAQYLAYAEAVTLYHDLRDAGITALVKTHGPPAFPFGDGIYYQLLIEETDAEAAQATVAAFEQQRATPLALRCPACHSPTTEAVARPTLWQRLYYAGTTLRRCATCGRRFAG